MEVNMSFNTANNSLSYMTIAENVLVSPGLHGPSELRADRGDGEQPLGDELQARDDRANAY